MSEIPPGTKMDQTELPFWLNSMATYWGDWLLIVVSTTKEWGARYCLIDDTGILCQGVSWTEGQPFSGIYRPHICVVVDDWTALTKDQKVSILAITTSRHAKIVDMNGEG